MASLLRSRLTPFGKTSNAQLKHHLEADEKVRRIEDWMMIRSFVESCFPGRYGGPLRSYIDVMSLILLRHEMNIDKGLEAERK